MYEKYGLMSQISNPLVIGYLRNHVDNNTLLVENALRRTLGLPIVENVPSKTRMAVKVTDPRLVDYLVSQRKLHGISHRHTIESAILKLIVEEGKGNERDPEPRH